MERWDILNDNELKGWEFGGIDVRSDGNILANFFKTNRIKKSSSRWEVKYLLMDLDGNKLDYTPFSYNTELRIVDDKDVTFPNIFPIGRTLTAISNEGELFAVNTQQMLIKKYNPQGIYESAIYYPVEGKPLKLNDFLNSERKFGPSIPTEDAIKKAYQDIGEELPKNSPVADKLIVDDENRIWVAVPAGQKYNFYEWWVLAETGKLLAKVTLPIEKQILDIKNGFLYTKEIDEETSADYVVKYRIDLTKIL
jgi:hypothetical protein